MQNLYPYAQIIHLFCAIIFVGYLFFDVIILGAASKKMPPELAQKAKQAIGSVAVKIMPICVLLLVLTGGMMMSNWVGSKAGGYFETDRFYDQILLSDGDRGCGDSKFKLQIYI